MSYARFSEGDVYVYQDLLTGAIRCVGCGGSAWSRSEMLEHLEWHVAQGHTVPARAFKRLRAEIVDGYDVCCTEDNILDAVELIFGSLDENTAARVEGIRRRALEGEERDGA